MVDQTFRSPDQTQSRPGSSPSTASSTDAAKNVASQAMAAGRDLKDKAVELAGTSADTLKTQASGLMDAAKDVAKDAASQATDRLKETAQSQKSAGAEVVGNFANAVRRAAGEFDNELPIAATYIRKAATSIDGFSEQIKNGDLNDLVRGAQSFARRQPTAFLGLAVLAGFGLVRFLKSSADHAQTPSSGSQGMNRRGQGLSNDHYY